MDLFPPSQSCFGMDLLQTFSPGVLMQLLDTTVYLRYYL